MENRDMRRKNLNFEKIHWPSLYAIAAAAILAAGCFSLSASAQQKNQQTFSSPEEASNALVTAAKNNDENAMREVLGPDGNDIVSSGDDVEDSGSRANFVQRYQEMHRLVKEPDGTTTLYIGAENWPTPIPIVNNGHAWYFETEIGKQEILFRRIGLNELSAVEVCKELVAAEKEFSANPKSEYAQKIFSDEGRHNGLYWKAADGDTESPIGPLVAAAAAKGYVKTQDAASAPYRGYYFRILTSAGKNAPGGARSYISDGKMTGGFAFVAYPAEYRSSGVMTFIVNQDGAVYQKDLGRKTSGLATAMKAYDPNPSWQKAEEKQMEAADEQMTK
jgi:hypothetical protein